VGPRTRTMRQPRRGPVATTPRADASPSAINKGALSKNRRCPAPGSRSASLRSTRRKTAAATRATSSSRGAGVGWKRGFRPAERL
jgi:hypothetical protein